VGDHHQAAGETDPVAGAGYRAVVGQVFGDLFEPAPDEAVEWLQEEDGFTESVEELPGRIAAGQVGEFVREEALLMFEGEIADPLGTADLRLSDARGKGHCDGRRRAQSNRLSQTHGCGQAVEEAPRGTKATRFEEPSEIDNRATEDQQCQKRSEAPQGEQSHRPGVADGWHR